MTCHALSSTRHRPRRPASTCPSSWGLPLGSARLSVGGTSGSCSRRRPSDLGGTDELVHGGTPRGLLRALTNALARSRHRPTVAELEQIYADLVTAAGAIKKSLGTDSSTVLVRSRSWWWRRGSARVRGSPHSGDDHSDASAGRCRPRADRVRGQTAAQEAGLGPEAGAAKGQPIS